MRLLYVNTTQGPREVTLLMEASGLAVTESTRGTGWSITHKNSGMTVVAAEFQETTARKLCLEIGLMAQWEELTYDGVIRWRQLPSNAEAMRRAVAAARAEDAS